MLKKILLVAGLAAGLMATNAWAGNAMSCLSLTHPLNTSGNGLKNICSHPVEAAWCITKSGYCDRFDNQATIQPGNEFPLAAHQGDAIYYDGCDGANSIKGQTGSRNLTCK